MKQLIRLVIALLVCFPAVSKSQITTKIITELDAYEPFDAHVFHNNHVWVARSRKNLAAFYRLEVYDKQGALVVSKPVNHSLRYMYPYDQDSVIIVGTTGNPSQSHYTIARLKGNDVVLSWVKIPETAFADRWAGKPGKMFFTDPGGLDEGGSLTEPLKTIFTMGAFGPRYLNAKMRGPRHMLHIGNALYVIGQPQIGPGNHNLVRVNLADYSMTRLFATGKTYLANLIELSANRIATADSYANEVFLLDTTINREIHRLEIAEPRAMVQFGNCLAVGSERSRKLSFIDLRNQKMVASWDLSVAGNKFLGIRNVAADFATGRIYARSAYACSPVEPCDPERNSVILAEEAGGTTRKACE